MIDSLLRPDFKLVDKRDTIASLFGWLKGETDKAPIVCDDGRPWGVVNERSLVSSRIDRHAKVERHTTSSRVLAREADVREALAAVAEARVPYVPVADSPKRVAGFVRAVDLLDHLETPLDAEALMVATPTGVPVTATIGEAIKHLGGMHVPVLPVVDANGHYAGHVARSDVVVMVLDARPDGRKPPGNLADPREPALEGILDPAGPTVRPRANFDEVREALRDFRAVVVVDGNERPVGVVTAEGVIHAALAAPAEATVRHGDARFLGRIRR